MNRNDKHDSTTVYYLLDYVQENFIGFMLKIG